MNLFASLILAVLGAYIVYTRVSEHKQINQDLKRLDAENRFMKMDNTKGVMIFYGLGCLLAAVGMTVGFMFNDYNISVLGFVLGCMSIAELLTMKSHHRLYYNKSGFLLNGKVIRYKSIKTIQPAGKLPGGARKIETYGGETYRLPRKYVDIIEQMKEKKLDD